jgi:hypothetical protein
MALSLAPAIFKNDASKLQDNQQLNSTDFKLEQYKISGLFLRESVMFQAKQICEVQRKH